MDNLVTMQLNAERALKVICNLIRKKPDNKLRLRAYSCSQKGIYLPRALTVVLVN